MAGAGRLRVPNLPNVESSSSMLASTTQATSDSISEGSSAGIDDQGGFHLFSFGSNSSIQLAARVGRSTAIPARPGYLHNHTRIFAGYSQRWKGAVASVHPSAGSRVYGSIVKLTDAELDILDTYEGGYDRQVLHVRCQASQLDVPCYVYIKTSTTATCLPSEAYLQAIHRMLSETSRVHRSTIMIRRVDAQNGQVVTMGSWDPATGFNITEQLPETAEAADSD